MYLGLHPQLSPHRFKNHISGNIRSGPGGNRRSVPTYSLIYLACPLIYIISVFGRCRLCPRSCQALEKLPARRLPHPLEPRLGFNLREFVFNSRHPDPRRVLGRCRAAVRGPDPLDPGESGDVIIFARFRYVLQYLVTRVTLRCNVFLTFSYPSHLKHLLLRAFLESCFPEMLSKVGVLAERSLKK